MPGIYNGLHQFPAQAGLAPAGRRFQQQPLERGTGYNDFPGIFIVVPFLRLAVDVRKFGYMPTFRTVWYPCPFRGRKPEFRTFMDLCGPVRPQPGKKAGQHRLRYFVYVQGTGAQVVGKGIKGRPVLAPGTRGLFQQEGIGKLEEVQTEKLDIVGRPYLPYHLVDVHSVQFCGRIA